MIDLSKLKEVLVFRSKPRSIKPSKVLDLRITVEENGSTTSGLLWDIGDAGLGPRGGQKYVRPAENPAGVLGMLALRLDDMEREIRAEVARNRRAA